MKTKSKSIIILSILVVGLMITGINLESNVKFDSNEKIKTEANEIEEIQEGITVEYDMVALHTSAANVAEVTASPIVYNGLTMQELTDQLNKSLHGHLANTGHIFAEESISRGIDPYLALGIVLHETGCNGTCSSLVINCNNVGGMKGAGGCNGGSYAVFSTLESGIISYLDNLKRNYYDYGLTTVYTIGPKYAASTTWATQVTNYMNSIANK